MTSKDMAPRDEPVPTRADSKQGGQFVERMFSGFAHTSDLPSAPTRQRSEEPYRPLRQSRPGPGASYRLQSRTPELRVRLSSPATDVMTDLSRVAAVTIPAAATVDQAHQTMITERVRALFV